MDKKAPPAREFTGEALVLEGKLGAFTSGTYDKITGCVNAAGQKIKPLTGLSTSSGVLQFCSRADVLSVFSEYRWISRNVGL